MLEELIDHKEEFKFVEGLKKQQQTFKIATPAWGQRSMKGLL